MKRLSFCIPVFNRGDTIHETLESICRQYVDSIEIIVYDSGTDELTKKIVRRYQKSYPDIHYYNPGTKGGIDQDIEKTVALANGEYCWLLSGDDALAEGALKLALQELAKKRDVYLCNRIVCDQKLAPLKNRSWLKNSPRAVYAFKNRAEIFEYLASAQEMGAVFSFMSVIIVKNTAWRAAPDNCRNFGSCYAHINKIFGILIGGGEFQFIESPLILNRSFNDSFLESGILNRFLIDFRGFLEIAQDLFPEDYEIRRLFVELMIREHPWYQLVKIKSHTQDESIWAEIKKGLLEYGYNRNMLRGIEWLGTYHSVVKISVKAKAFLNKLFIRKYLFSIRQHGMRKARHMIEPGSSRRSFLRFKR